MKQRFKNQQLNGTTYYYMKGQKPIKQQADEESGCKDTAGKNMSTAAHSLVWQ